MSAISSILLGSVMLPLGIWSIIRGVKGLITGSLPAEEARWREKYSEQHGDAWLRPLFYAAAVKYCVCGLAVTVGGAMSLYWGVMLWIDPSFLDSLGP